MSTLPRYLVTHSDEQRLVIFRTDGAPITDDEAQFFRNQITAALRTMKLMESAQVNLDAALHEPDVEQGVGLRTGSVVRVHPLVNRIKSIIRDNGWALSKVSRMLGKGDAALSTWFRGQASPSMADVVALFGLAAYKLVPVPLEIVDDVEASVAMAEEKRKEEAVVDSLG